MFVDVEKDGRIKTILTNSAAEDSVIVKHPQARGRVKYGAASYRIFFC